MPILCELWGTKRIATVDFRFETRLTVGFPRIIVIHYLSRRVQRKCLLGTNRLKILPNSIRLAGHGQFRLCSVQRVQ